MSAVVTPIETLRNTILKPTNGVLGMVDDLLQTCAENHLDVDWTMGHCRVRIDGHWEDVDVATIRKSVFRAILARIAALCNEQTHTDVSPYGGQGQLSVGRSPAKMSFSFSNTPDEQRLKILSQAI